MFGSWADYLAAGDGRTVSNSPGAYGVDTENNVVWAALNHKSEFSVIIVPEPRLLPWPALASPRPPPSAAGGHDRNASSRRLPPGAWGVMGSPKNSPRDVGHQKPLAEASGMTRAITSRDRHHASNHPIGGGSSGSPRWVRIFRIGPGSVMKAISRMSPPHAGHSSGNSSPIRAMSLAFGVGRCRATGASPECRSSLPRVVRRPHARRSRPRAACQCSRWQAP
jgi:hypothetical protein